MRVTRDEMERIKRLFCGQPATEQAALAYLRHQFGTDDVSKLTSQQARHILNNPYEFARKALAFHQPELAL